MTAQQPKRSFASRPGDAESWIRTPDIPRAAPPRTDTFTARLTIDVTPELRGRIKVAAFRRSVTVADMLREMLAREFPRIDGEPK
jgi:hypothetical protein